MSPRPVLLCVLAAAIAGGCERDTNVPVDDADTGLDGDVGDDIADVADANDTDADPDTTIPDTTIPDTDRDAEPDSPDSGDPDTAEDTAEDTEGDVPPDTTDAIDDPPDALDAATDVGAGCGNGRIEGGEECDDGNRVDEDSCTNACVRSYCGDGTINATLGTESVVGPTVVGFGSRIGRVCDDGATCTAGTAPVTCVVEDDGHAPEHGICEHLGFDEAVSVTWGDGPGEADAVMHHAYNWECFDYDCVESPFSSYVPDCATSEMLAAITCRGIVGEECDDGPDNLDAPDHCRSDCRLPTCGDRIVDTLEECDDGADNTRRPDACRPDCALPACGDAIVDTGEQCDTGTANADRPDTCRTNCRLPACRDGIVDTGEECDDGNATDDDGCSNLCRLPGCGDGVVQAGEECDDGNATDDDGCTRDCLLPQCGDGVVQAGEECDDGNVTDHDGCSNTCVAARCGDGRTQTESFDCTILAVYDTSSGLAGLELMLGEAGYDGASLANDRGGVTSNYAALAEYPFVIFHNYDRAISTAEHDALEAYVQGGGTLLVTGYDSLGNPTDPLLADVLRIDTAGDGPFDTTCTILHEGHPITDGPYGSWPAGTTFSASASDHDNVSVREGTVSVASVAGAAKITVAENIGPRRGRALFWNGNSGLGDWQSGGTSEALFMNLVEAYCRGVSEECDDGDANADLPGATCRTDCRLPHCGDGVLDDALGEQCDDGNVVSADECTNACTRPRCGDGVLHPGEACDDGNESDSDACRNTCVRQVCGDGFLADAEQCDDGDANADLPDASCRTDCTNPRCGDGIVDTGEACDDGNPRAGDGCEADCGPTP